MQPLTPPSPTTPFQDQLDAQLLKINDLVDQINILQAPHIPTHGKD